MSVFASILGKVFDSNESTASVTAASTTPVSAIAAKASGPVMHPAAFGDTVDVAAVLSALAAKKKGETLNWRKSIVDLLKLLDLDSSAAARKKLAGELAYTGETNDSATMNIWLHKQVMRKLAENGGKVPADLKD